jgi:hypothetical protein
MFILIPRQQKPNQRLETNRWQPGRFLGVDGISHGLGVGLATWSAVVAHPDRYA